MAAYTLGSADAGRDPLWSRVRSALARANPEFRDAAFTPMPPAVTKPAVRDPPLVGPSRGRTWEIVYYRPTFFSPSPLLNIVTAIRWDDPGRMVHHETPWLYIGGRPRIFSRLSPDLDWIVEKQRRAERNLAGYKTGDPAFDRRWACYAYRSNPATVLQNAGRRRWLQGLRDLRLRRGDDAPTIASLGTTVSMGLAVRDSEDTVRQARDLVGNFGQMLDEIEVSTGNPSATQVALPMDLLPDGTGYPSPTLRFRCVWCGQETHPRFVREFHTEICEQCRKGLYDSW